MMKIVKLLEPTEIGFLKLKNRIIMAPMAGGGFASETGEVTQRLIDFYVERAKGGVGLIIIGGAWVDKPAKEAKWNGVNELYIYDDIFIKGLKILVESIKLCDTKTAIQLHFSLPRGKFEALKREDIKYFIEAYSESALRAKKAGFDSVELQGAHAYLIAQFLSSHTNKRTDKYGGNLDGRTEFALEIIRRTRKKVGSAFPIIFRINGKEFVEGGLTLKETKVITPKLEEAGANAIHVSVGCGPGIYGACEWTQPPMCVPQGWAVNMANEIKKVVNIPVVVVGRINDPVLAEKIIVKGEADLVAMCRALIADPYLPKKAMDGRLEDIRKCLGCNMGCTGRFDLGIDHQLTCDVNAAVGKEREYIIEKIDIPKKIVVVGGGPAGMEAARIAALRGHEVILYEKEPQLGGQLILASASPFKKEVKNLIAFLTHQIEKVGVRVRLGEEFKPEMIHETNPDAIVVAEGAVPLTPKIPGIESQCVLQAWDVLAGRKKTGESVVIIGGGAVGCETAEFLIEKGKKVTIVEMLEDIAMDMGPRARKFLKRRLEKGEVKVSTGMKVKKIKTKGVIMEDKERRRTHFLGSDNVVLATGSVASKKLRSLKGERVHFIGDCVEPRQIIDAVHEGSKVGRLI